MVKPVEQVSAWLFGVARNRITDLFRSKKRQAVRDEPVWLAEAEAEAEEDLRWEDLLPSADAGPESAYARGVLLEEVDAALDELPEEQREVFIAHELMGYSFKEIAAQTGVGVKTLLSRKHYAVSIRRYSRGRQARNVRRLENPQTMKLAKRGTRQ